MILIINIPMMVVMIKKVICECNHFQKSGAFIEPSPPSLNLNSESYIEKDIK